MNPINKMMIFLAVFGLPTKTDTENEGNISIKIQTPGNLIINNKLLKNV